MSFWLHHLFCCRFGWRAQLLRTFCRGGKYKNNASPTPSTASAGMASYPDKSTSSKESSSAADSGFYFLQNTMSFDGCKGTKNAPFSSGFLEVSLSLAEWYCIGFLGVLFPQTWGDHLYWDDQNCKHSNSLQQSFEMSSLQRKNLWTRMFFSSLWFWWDLLQYSWDRWLSLIFWWKFSFQTPLPGGEKSLVGSFCCCECFHDTLSTQPAYGGEGIVRGGGQSFSPCK